MSRMQYMAEKILNTVVPAKTAQAGSRGRYTNGWILWWDPKNRTHLWCYFRYGRRFWCIGR